MVCLNSGPSCCGANYHTTSVVRGQRSPLKTTGSGLEKGHAVGINTRIATSFKAFFPWLP